MPFFDFLLLHIAVFYKRHGERSAESTSIVIVGGLLMLNFITIYFLVIWAMHEYYNIGIIIGGFVFFQIVAMVWYSRKPEPLMEKILEKWEAKPRAYKTRIVAFEYLYIVGSVLSSFGVAISQGSQR